MKVSVTFDTEYNPKHEADDSLCYCNRPRKLHPNINSVSPKWNCKSHTTTFKAKNQQGIFDNGAHYLRCDVLADAKGLKSMLFETWQVKPDPRLIISIIGGTKYFNLTDKLETKFMDALINMAINSDAWLLTNGFNVGIVQYVGQAIHKSKLTNVDKPIVAIGLPEYGCIKNLKQLKNPQKTSLQAASDGSCPTL
ncbi:unnamed protein product [Didymodactylos carnosus]|uniref:TRPM SLOG domain-containing protein n=1 Tax=Didymodactylos carnosus TaxID=1234261 RepID=A0A8S2E6S4_9BILA|nr:unnamed protein product [Didymodactylos carnosus]CAF3833671.1 unnamed protein product [Didymodactylos carnosus]